MCIPPYNLLAEGVYLTYGMLNGLITNITDSVSAKAVINNTLPFTQSLFDSISASISLQATLPSVFPQPISDSVTLSLDFQATIPSNETITYYVPLDIAVTYTIEVYQISYSGQLNYSVSGS